MKTKDGMNIKIYARPADVSVEDYLFLRTSENTEKALAEGKIVDLDTVKPEQRVNFEARLRLAFMDEAMWQRYRAERVTKAPWEEGA